MSEPTDQPSDQPTDQPTDQFEQYERDVDDQLDPDQQLDLDQAFGDDEVDDALDVGYSPPEKPLGLDEVGVTAEEQERGETFEERVAQEIPDPNLASDLEAEPTEFVDDGEVGAERAGRLVAPDAGLAEDREKDLVAGDVGIDGGAASAEEAAVHIVEE